MQEPRDNPSAEGREGAEAPAAFPDFTPVGWYGPDGVLHYFEGMEPTEDEGPDDDLGFELRGDR